MPHLTDAQKTHIVMLLATFDTPIAVVVRMREDAGIEIDRSQVIRYDPTKPCFEGSERWREIFWATRKAYLEQLDPIPIAHKAYRLNELQRIYGRASQSGNLVLAMATLRQAAEEVGGALTNEQTLNVRRPVDEMTAEERRAAMTELVRKALSQKEPPSLSTAA